MNRVILRIGVIATMAALSALTFSTAGAGTAAAQSLGNDGTIHACYKAKGKNKGALRVVPTSQGCRKLPGFRPVSWSASGPPGGTGSQGVAGTAGEQGPQGDSGAEGKEGPQGVASQVEKTLIDTVKTQAGQIDTLNKQVTDLTAEVLDLGGKVIDLTGGVTSFEDKMSVLVKELVDLEVHMFGLEDEIGGLEDTVTGACAQLTTLTKQTDEILTSLLGSSVAILGNLLNVPNPPAQLGAFKCS